METNSIDSYGGPYIFFSESRKDEWENEVDDLNYDKLNSLLDDSTEVLQNVEIHGFNALIVVEPYDVLKLTDTCFIQIFSCDVPDEILDNSFIKNIIENQKSDMKEIYSVNISKGQYIMFDAARNYESVESENGYLNFNLPHDISKIEWECYDFPEICFYYFNLLS